MTEKLLSEALSDRVMMTKVFDFFLDRNKRMVDKEKIYNLFCNFILSYIKESKQYTNSVKTMLKVGLVMHGVSSDFLAIKAFSKALDNATMIDERIVR